MRKIFISTLLSCFAFYFLHAQNLLTSENRDVSVWEDNFFPSVFYFPIDQYKLMHDYSSNKITFDALDEILTNNKTVENIDTIEIIGACSPVASEEYNRKLAINRCLSLHTYLLERYPQLTERFPMKMNIIGIDHRGYNVLKKRQPQLTEKETWDKLQYVAVRLKMKDNSYIVPSSNKHQVDINNITARDTIYLKCDTVYIKDTMIIRQEIEQNNGTTYVRDTIYTRVYLPYSELKSPLYLALKTNLIYDALLLPNLTAEIYLGRKWSLAVEGNWSWWNFDKPIQNWWYHRIQAAGAELRYWVKSPYPLQGHAVGLYSMIGNYDVRFFAENEDSKGYLSYQSWSAGLSYAYSMPIAHKFNLEFGLAFGYMGGRYYQYDYCMRHEQWEQNAINNRRYFGPTRVGISLVWLIGTGNSPKDKDKYTMWQNRKSNNMLTQNNY